MIYKSPPPPLFSKEWLDYIPPPPPLFSKDCLDYIPPPPPIELLDIPPPPPIELLDIPPPPRNWAQLTQKQKKQEVIPSKLKSKQVKFKRIRKKTEKVYYDMPNDIK